MPKLNRIQQRNLAAAQEIMHKHFSPAWIDSEHARGIHRALSDTLEEHGNDLSGGAFTKFKHAVSRQIADLAPNPGSTQGNTYDPAASPTRRGLPRGIPTFVTTSRDRRGFNNVAQDYIDTLAARTHGKSSRTPGPLGLPSALPALRKPRLVRTQSTLPGATGGSVVASSGIHAPQAIAGILGTGTSGAKIEGVQPYPSYPRVLVQNNGGSSGPVQSVSVPELR